MITDALLVALLLSQLGQTWLVYLILNQRVVVQKDVPIIIPPKPAVTPVKRHRARTYETRPVSEGDDE